ncbi:MAG: hypothetical protein CL921_06385, partial [Deltaproteobacteria bacterium]|nr:hypothetical protein [Deltaproteobacteria bacterium]
MKKQVAKFYWSKWRFRYSAGSPVRFRGITIAFDAQAVKLQLVTEVARIYGVHFERSPRKSIKENQYDAGFRSMNQRVQV